MSSKREATAEASIVELSRFRKALGLPVNKSAHNNTSDIELKMVVAKNVVLACKMEQYFNDTSGKSKFSHYSGIDDLDAVISYMENAKKPTSFYAALKVAEGSEDIYNSEDLATYRKVRDLLEDFYINLRIIPTSAALSDTIDVPEDLDDNFFMWKRIPGTTKAIIIEKPELINARIRYNLAMERFRLTARCIIYVEKFNLKKWLQSKEFWCSAATNTTYLFMAVSAAGVHHSAIKEIAEDSSETLLTWILDLLPTLPESSVLVLPENESPKISKDPDIVPKITSTKKQMIKWLEDNNIPHNTETHRAELFSLIQKYSGFIEERVDLGKELFKCHNIDLVFRPKTMPDICYDRIYNILWKSINFKVMGTKKIVILQDILDKIEMISSDQTKLFEMELAECETYVHNQDMKMEIVIDRILAYAASDSSTMIQYNHVEMARLDDFDPGKKLPKFILS